MEKLVDAVFGNPDMSRRWNGAIILQGPYLGIDTQRAIKEFLSRNSKDTLLILSSYIPNLKIEGFLSPFEVDQLNNPSAEHFSRFICISCHVPEREKYPKFWETNLYNQNLQRLSTFVGFDYAQQLGIEVGLKMRSDAFLAIQDCCSVLRDMVDNYPLNKLADHEQKARILVSDLCVLVDDRNPDWQRLGPYFIADVWSFGYVSDMMRYFDMREGSLWNRGAGMPTADSSETNLAICWKKEMKIREDMKALEMLSRYFIVSHHDDVLFFWPRWWNYDEAIKSEGGITGFLKSQPWTYPERFTHKQWAELNL